MRDHRTDLPLLLRLRYHAFEVAIAIIVAVQGIAALAGGALLDPTNVLLPEWQAVIFHSGRALSGLCILLGLALRRGDLEGAGLVLLGSLLIARAFLVGELLGWQPDSYTSLAFSAFFAGACVGRLMVLGAYGKGHRRE